MYCSACGVAVRQDLTYCKNCGAKLNGKTDDNLVKSSEIRPEALIFDNGLRIRARGYSNFYGCDEGSAQLVCGTNSRFRRPELSNNAADRGRVHLAPAES